MSNVGHLTPRPAHIPDAAVFDFDIFRDPALLQDPHERVREVIREAPPVFWTPRNGGHWMAVNYADVHRVARDPETFSSSLFPPEMLQAMQALIPAGAPRIPQITPIMMDPPEHTKFRAPLLKTFSPKSALALKGEIDELANRLVDAVVDQGHCEFIGAVAEQLPVRVFLKMMGLPAERLAEFRALVRELLAPRSDTMDGSGRSRRIADAMLDVILARKADPKDDLISELWALEIDGEPMSLDLMEDYTTLLFIAGLDTVINAMGYGVRHLASNPDLQRELRANPKLIPEAAEELLRRYSFTVPIRRATRDTELAGWTLKSGDHVYLYMAAADLDAKEFPSPERIDIGRENNVHIAFGAGPHRCLGSHLARVELQSLYSVVLKKLPLFRLDPDKPVEFSPSNIISVVSLPLRWD